MGRGSQLSMKNPCVQYLGILSWFVCSSVWVTFFSPFTEVLAESQSSSDFDNSRRIVSINAHLGGLAENIQISDGFLWNPANLAFSEKSQITLIGTPILSQPQDARDYVPIRRASGLSATASGQQLSLNSAGGFSIAFWREDWSGQPTNLSKYQIGAAVSYGIPWSEQLGIGSTIRYFKASNQPFNTDSDESMNAQMALDLGLHYRQSNFLWMNRTATFDFALMDLGNLAEENNGPTNPFAQLGSIYHLTPRTHLSASWNLGASVNNNNKVQLGIEQWFFALPDSLFKTNNMGIKVADGYFALRAGLTIPTQKSKSNLSYPYQIGTTFQTGNLQSKNRKTIATLRLEYAYTRWSHLPRTVDHWIAATINWGKNTTIQTKNQKVEIGESIIDIEPNLIRSAETIVTNSLPAPLDFSSRLIASPSIFSPSLNGGSDVVTFTFGALHKGIENNQKVDDWILEIRDEYQRIVQKYTHFRQNTDRYQVIWDGTNFAQNPLTDGQYTAKVIWQKPNGEKVEHSRATIIIDTIAPTFSLSAEPVILVNDALSVEGHATHRSGIDLRYEDSAISHWEVKLVENGKKVLEETSGYGSPPNPFFWKLKMTTLISESNNNEGAYHYVATLCDLAGNCQTKTIPISVIDLRTVSSRQEKRGLVISLPCIMFETDSYEIEIESYVKELGEISQAIAAYPEAQVVIEGHTDDVGDENYNLELSERRAEVVQQYLIDHFQVNPDRLLAIGRGEQSPILPNNSNTNRQRNRRVDIILLTRESETSQSSDFINEKDRLMDGEYYTLLVGSFQNEQNAIKLARKLEEASLLMPIQVSRVTTTGSRQVWYRVMVGKFYKKSIALNKANDLPQSITTKPLLILAND